MKFSEIWWIFLLLAIGSYLFGNINNALIISKLKKSDVRKIGSGNPGTLNMSRNFGIKIGFLTLFLDALKGVIPVLTGWLIFRGKCFAGTDFEICDLSKYLCGVCAILGHIYPVFMKFKGGKGIATTIGVFAASMPILAIGLVALVFVYIYVTEYGSMGSLIIVTPLAIVALFKLYFSYDGLIVPTAAMIVTNLLILTTTFLTWFAHRKNIARLVGGTEHPTSIKKMLSNKKEKKNSSQA